MTYTTLRVCASRGAFEAIPDGNVRLDLPKLRGRLEARGVSVMDCRVMLIAQFDREVTIGVDGRILIKSREKDEAERILAEVRPVVESS